MNMEQRIAELEIKLSYSEDLLEQINLTVFRQQQQIEQLQQALRGLHQQILAATPAEPGSPRDDIPPHY